MHTEEARTRIIEAAKRVASDAETITAFVGLEKGKRLFFEYKIQFSSPERTWCISGSGAKTLEQAVQDAIAELKPYPSHVNMSDEYHPDLGAWVQRVDLKLSELGIPTLGHGQLEQPQARGVPTDPMQRPSWSIGKRWVSARYEHRPSDDARDYQHCVRASFDFDGSEKPTQQLYLLNDVGADDAAAAIAKHLS